MSLDWTFADALRRSRLWATKRETKGEGWTAKLHGTELATKHRKVLADRLEQYKRMGGDPTLDCFSDFLRANHSDATLLDALERARKDINVFFFFDIEWIANMGTRRNLPNLSGLSGAKRQKADLFGGVEGDAVALCRRICDAIEEFEKERTDRSIDTFHEYLRRCDRPSDMQELTLRARGAGYDLGSLKLACEERSESPASVTRLNKVREVTENRIKLEQRLSGLIE